MITKTELLQEEHRKSWEHDLQKREYYHRCLRRHLDLVQRLANGALVALIKDANRKGIKTIHMDREKLYEETNIRNHNLHLGFEFDPEYEPTKKLLKILQSHGFSATIITETRQNYSRKTYSNGDYQYVDEPGVYNKYYLQISWQE